MQGTLSGVRRLLRRGACEDDASGCRWVGGQDRPDTLLIMVFSVMLLTDVFRMPTLSRLHIAKQHMASLVPNQLCIVVT